MIVVFEKIFAIATLLLLLSPCGFSQEKIGVIADTQSPLRTELLWSKAEHNIEATDTLFACLSKEPVSAVFFLGDLTAMGSRDRYWVPIDRFLATLHQKNIRTYAIPGNHEYSFPASAGIAEFYRRFPQARKLIEMQVIDSTAMVLLDTNYGKLSRKQKEEQAERYRHCMDSLQHDPAVRAIIVCVHQSPYTNSTGVGPAKEVQKRLIPVYAATPKAVLFLSGHSHNLERFRRYGKNFLVIGGGGGLRQPLLSHEKQRYYDLMPPDERLRFFYIIIERERNMLSVKAKGMDADDFSKQTEKEIMRISIKE